MPVAAAPTADARPARISPGELVRETLGALRNHRGSLVDFVEELLVEMEQMSQLLDEKERDIDVQQKQLSDHEHQLAQQRDENERIQHALDSQQSQLESLLDEVAAVRSELAEGRTESVAASHDDGELASRLKQIEAQRDEMQQQFTAAAEDARQARAELDEVRRAAGDDSEVEQQRLVLESELELVRHRAAELTEQLADQKDELHQQQTLWAGELRQLRQLVATSIAHGPASGESVQLPESAIDDDHHEVEAEDDLVVDSIMAQFNKLQQDVAKRRQRKTT